MVILGIETSCDETAAALVKDGTKILSNIVASSLSLHAKTGGIIPENAAREQLKFIIPVIEESFQKARLKENEIDAIAVTQGPGLIGSLLVGVETAKTLSYAWNKPLIPVNHLLGHIYANFLDTAILPEFPFIALIVSGGHTDLLYVKGHGQYEWLGGTRDDAAGEAFDKTARLLGLPYPGGPEIAKLAEKGNPKAFKLPRPMMEGKNYDFSFSGLKTAVSALVKNWGDSEERSQRVAAARSRARTHVEKPSWQDPNSIEDLAASIQEAIIEVLVAKTTRAARDREVEEIVLGGGVAANKLLRERMQKAFYGQVFAPKPSLATDNGAVIASTAHFLKEKAKNPKEQWKTLEANPNLHF